MRAIEAEDFLILPTPEVLTYMRNKTADYNRWIGGMRKLEPAGSTARLKPEVGGVVGADRRVIGGLGRRAPSGPCAADGSADD